MKKLKLKFEQFQVEKDKKVGKNNDNREAKNGLNTTIAINCAIINLSIRWNKTNTWIYSLITRGFIYYLKKFEVLLYEILKIEVI